MKFIIVAAAYGFIFIIVEVFAARLRPPEELARKLSHIMAGIGAALLPFALSFPEIALLGVLFVPAVLVSMKLKLFKSVHGVNRSTYGEVYFPLSIALTALLFPDRLLFTYAILTIGISDALASLFGLRYGRKKYRVKGGHKSYFGSAVFFVSTLAIGVGLTMLAGTQLIPAVLVSAAIAAALTIVEALSGKGLDNLFVPLAAGGLLGFAKVIGLLGN